MNTQNTPHDFDSLDQLPAPAISPAPWWTGYANAESADTSTLAIWPATVKEGGFGAVVCKVSPELTKNETDEVNAQVLAAAPELLDALRAAGRTIRSLHGEAGWELYQRSPEMQKINAALAKALIGDRTE